MVAAIRTGPVSSGPHPTFIDLFSGCGGLSLGLVRAGWRGVFAVEKDPNAFATYQHNLLDRFSESYEWPSWLPKTTIGIDDLLTTKRAELAALRGKVTLIAGGPPCQGFSSAGRRDANDPRNDLVQSYLSLVSLIEPEMVLLENVRGITVDFRRGTSDAINYSAHLQEKLAQEYVVGWRLLNTAHFGVPQARSRFILIGIRKGSNMASSEIDEVIERHRLKFLRTAGLVLPVSSRDALSDLEVTRNGTEPYSGDPAFSAIRYKSPRSRYQRLMKDGHNGTPSDLRLANHRPEIRDRFAAIIATCKKGGRLNTSLGPELRAVFGLRKMALRVLDPDVPSPTITSLPDDLLHYNEPRTLTVRENARLQGFPDWFAFQGKYTSGGKRRRLEVPRFTQVANAVPPYVAEVLGAALLSLLPLGPTRELGHWHIINDGDTREIGPMLDQITA